MRSSYLALLSCFLIAAGCFFTAPINADITNGGFETGDLTGWTLTDIATPFDVAQVLVDGTATEFDGFGPEGNEVRASQGDFAFNNGFDGAGPGVISLAQDIGVIESGDVLLFDYRVGWDLENFGSPLLDRSFLLLIEPAGGGFPLSLFPIFTASAGTTSFGINDNDDSGGLKGEFDLSPFAGLDARINFVWSVPEDFTGPANAQLDNVRFQVPEPGAMGILGLMSLVAFRRRQR